MTAKVNKKSNPAFFEDCRVVSMKKEYPGYTGEIKWIVVSDLDEAYLNVLYPEEMKEHSPYVFMSRQEFRPIVESHSNDRKHEMRMTSSYDAFSYEDGIFETFHPELVVYPFDGFDYEEIHVAISKLSSPHRERITKKFFCGMTIIEIAAEEGTTKQAISKSINKSLVLLRNYLQNG